MRAAACDLGECGVSELDSLLQIEKLVDSGYDYPTPEQAMSMNKWTLPGYLRTMDVAAGSSVGLTVDASGLVASDGFSKSEQIPGLEAKVREGSDLSLFAEISTPSGVKDTFFCINRSKPDTWQRIQLK